MTDVDQRPPTKFGLAAVLAPFWALVPVIIVTKVLLGSYGPGPGSLVLLVTLPFTPGPPLALIALWRSERAAGCAWFALLAYLVPGIIGVVYLSQCISRVVSGHTP